MVSETLTKRPLHLRKDFDQIVALLELVFAEEIEARGMDIRAELLTYKRFLPLFKILGLFSKMFRYPLVGFVFETKDKQIIASTNTSSIANRWEIAMVATHPDYRRRGLAKELVSDAIAFVKEKRGRMCSLEVIADNTPAYNLYRDLGFIHYDSIAEMKLAPDQWPEITNANLPEKYSITPLKRNNKTDSQRYELKIKETPNEVQDFVPIDKKIYKTSKLKKLLRPLMIRLVSLDVTSWTIYSQEELVGTIFVEFNKSGKNPHRIDLVIDPEHQQFLTKPMILFALSKINESNILDQNVLITSRSTNSEVMNILKELGFTIIENNHKLGLNLESGYYW